MSDKILSPRDPGQALISTIQLLQKDMYEDRYFIIVQTMLDRFERESREFHRHVVEHIINSEERKIESLEL